MPHEIGHWVDFLEKVERPALQNPSSDYSELLDRYYSRPTREKEQFAHAYAERMRSTLTARQAIPFGRQLNRDRLRQDNLLLQDFELG